jgi:hypothetical protein
MGGGERWCRIFSQSGDRYSHPRIDLINRAAV